MFTFLWMLFKRGLWNCMLITCIKLYMFIPDLRVKKIWTVVFLVFICKKKKWNDELVAFVADGRLLPWEGDPTRGCQVKTECAWWMAFEISVGVVCVMLTSLSTCRQITPLPATWISVRVYIIIYISVFLLLNAHCFISQNAMACSSSTGKYI